MKQGEIRNQWEAAAPGWARWESTVSAWMGPATEVMFTMADVDVGARVLDLACGAGSQTLHAARRVGARGHVVANDIAEAMLHHVQQNAQTEGLNNITTLLGAAEDVSLPAESFDAAISRLGLMLFVEPSKALAAVRRALRPGGKIAVVVFTTPAANPFMSQTMQILLRHAGKAPPAPGQPGIFSLGAPGVLEKLFKETGFKDVKQRTLALSLQLPSAAQALVMMQEAFGAYRAVIRDSSEAVQSAAWAEVSETLMRFETPAGLVAPTEVLVGACVKPA